MAQAQETEALLPPPYLLAAAASIAWVLLVILGSKWRGLPALPPVAVVVIAHPDDETMFFLPTLRALRATGCHIHLLCLSVGVTAPPPSSSSSSLSGADRTAELEAAVVALKLVGHHQLSLEFVNDVSLQDGCDNGWAPALVEEYVRHAVRRVGGALVISFDQCGVSGHANHVAACQGVRGFASSPAGAGVACYELVTVPLLRKFSGPLEVFAAAAAQLASVLCSRGRKGRELVVVCNPTPALGHAGMMAHASQYVWFRRLYVAFSSYMYVNILRRLR